MQFDFSKARISTHALAGAAAVMGIFLTKFMNNPDGVKWLGEHWFVHYILDTSLVAAPVAMAYLQPASKADSKTEDAK